MGLLVVGVRLAGCPGVGMGDALLEADRNRVEVVEASVTTENPAYPASSSTQRKTQLEPTPQPHSPLNREEPVWSLQL